MQATGSNHKRETSTFILVPWKQKDIIICAKNNRILFQNLYQMEF